MEQPALPRHSVLLEHARAFFAEVLRLRDQLLAGPSAGEEQEALDFNAVRQRLLERVQPRSWLLGGRGGDSLEERLHEEVRYLLVAFADEIFVHLSWSGQEAWRELLLEEELFHTHEAGERVFERVEALLRDEDPARGEVATVYLLVLALGFQGRYRDALEEAPLQELRRRLFAFGHHREPEPDLSSRHLFPQAYAHTQDERRDLRLARPWPWAAALAAVFVGYLVLGQLLWSWETRALREALRDVPEKGCVRP